MKAKLFQVLFISMSLLLDSCSRSDDTEIPVEVNNNQTITANIDGVAWSSIQGGAIANLSNVSTGNQSQSVIQIIGLKIDQTSITMQLPLNTISVGMHNFDSNDSGNLTYSSGNQFFSSLESNGNFTLNITSFNVLEGLLSGTFSGKIYDVNGTSFKTITNGVITNIKIISTSLYSNGTMNLKINSGNLFSMDSDNSDGKYLFIAQSSFDNAVVLNGYNINSGNDYGISYVNFPTNATVGSHAVTGNQSYSAGFSKTDDGTNTSASSGSIVVTSNSNKNIIGTFSFNVLNGTQVTTISNGSFNITYK